MVFRRRSMIIIRRERRRPVQHISVAGEPGGLLRAHSSYGFRQSQTGSHAGHPYTVCYNTYEEVGRTTRISVHRPAKLLRPGENKIIPAISELAANPESMTFGAHRACQRFRRLFQHQRGRWGNGAAPDDAGQVIRAIRRPS